MIILKDRRISSYAFGSPKNLRQFNLASARVGFNGKENDNDVKGTGNSIDFGGRIYDSRLGRWFSIDQLFAKRPYESPYVFVGNSPNINKEIDGRDYGVYVDHNTKTIVVKATFNTPKGDQPSSNEAKQSAEFWNNQTGKFQYRVTLDNGNYVFYDIKFDIKTNESDDVSQFAKQQFGAPISFETGKPDGEAHTEKGGGQEDNAFRVLSDNDKFFNVLPEKGAAKDRGGQTINETDIAVKTAYVGGNAGPHEIGHALGAGHVSSTVQDPTLGSTKSTINANVIKNILGNAGLGKTYNETTTKGTGKIVDTKGTAPANFDKGTIH